MKVVFLDIDGVLNSHRTVYAFGDFPHGTKPDAVALFDQVAVAMVRNLCRAAGAVVVLSSSWRKLHRWADVGAALGLPIIDATPSLGTIRGAEIADWLQRHPEVTHYAIVDDDSDMLPEQAGHFVQTNARDGLTMTAFEGLCAILGTSLAACHPRHAIAATKAQAAA